MRSGPQWVGKNQGSTAINMIDPIGDMYMVVLARFISVLLKSKLNTTTTLFNRDPYPLALRDDGRKRNLFQTPAYLKKENDQQTSILIITPHTSTN